MRTFLHHLSLALRCTVVASAVVCDVGAAQANPPGPTGPAPATPTPPTQASSTPTPATQCVAGATTARVTDAYRVAAEVPEMQGGGPVPVSRRVKLRDVIAVRVANLQALADELMCVNRADGKTRNVVLYLDDRPVKDLVAYPPTDPKGGLLLFTLQRTEQSRDVWTYLLGKPRLKARPTKVSIGIEDRYAIASTAYLDLRVLPTGWLTFWVSLFFALVVAFVWLAMSSDLLRDTVAAPAGTQRPPFSLARVQAAWWFFIALAAYLFIGLITGDFSTSITGTVLVLLGLSATTTIAAAIVDGSRSTPAEEAKVRDALVTVNNEISALESTCQQAEADLKNDEKNATASDSKVKAETELKVKISQRRKLMNESEQFFKDVLSDANGVSFHRFQMATWTLVLGLVFGVQVYRELAMPTFSETLLGLMGISAGTFVGLKATEAVVPKKS